MSVEKVRLLIDSTVEMVDVRELFAVKYLVHADRRLDERPKQILEACVFTTINAQAQQGELQAAIDWYKAQLKQVESAECPRCASLKKLIKDLGV